MIQFNRFNIISSTTTTSSDLDPPLAPPPPPPPLNIAPSRARRQLARRLALKNAENASSSNGNEPEPEKSELLKNLNPFATEEDEDEDEPGAFTIGDLEIAAEGKGILPPATSLTGQQVPLRDLNVDIAEGNGRDDNVGISKSSVTRSSFPSMWPFGQVHRPGHNPELSASYREKSRERERATVRLNSLSEDFSALDNKNDSW
jgi:hypothetical protein